MQPASARDREAEPFVSFRIITVPLIHNDGGQYLICKMATDRGVFPSKWGVIPDIVLPFLFQHAVQGWCPPVPLLRRLGVRSREEIDREKYALKVLRGDFEGTHGHAAADEKASDALSAVKV